MARSVGKPLAATVSALQALARGETGVVIEGRDRKDEIGGIAVAFDACQALAVEKARREQEEANARDAAERARRDECAVARPQRRGRGRDGRQRARAHEDLPRAHALEERHGYDARGHDAVVGRRRDDALLRVVEAQARGDARHRARDDAGLEGGGAKDAGGGDGGEAEENQEEEEVVLDEADGDL